MVGVPAVLCAYLHTSHGDCVFFHISLWVGWKLTIDLTGMFPRGSVPSMPWFWSFAAGAAFNGLAPRHVDRSTSFLGRTFWSIFLLSNLNIKCLLIRNRFLFSSNAQSQFYLKFWIISKFCDRILMGYWCVVAMVVVVMRLLSFCLSLLFPLDVSRFWLFLFCSVLIKFSPVFVYFIWALL